MKKIASFEYLKVFKESELRELQEISYLKRFSYDQNDHQLLAYLIEQFPDFEEEKLSKAKICEHFKWSDAQWKRALTHLRKLLLTYMQWIADEKETSQWRYAADFLIKRGQVAQADRLYQQAEKKLQEQNQKGIAYYLQKCVIDFSRFEFKPLHDNKIESSNFLPFLASVESLFIFVKSLAAFELIGTKEFIESSSENWMEEEVLSEARLRASENPMFKFFADLRQLEEEARQIDLSKTDEKEILKKFQDLRVFFKENYPILENDIACQQTLTYLINFAIARKRKRIPGFVEEQLQLLSLGMESGISLINGQIKEVRFQNLIVAAASNADFERAEWFINNYFDKIAFVMPREEFLHFCWAIICYFKREFDDCINHLRFVRTSDPQRKMIIKGIEIQCYYEIYFEQERDSNFLLTKIDNFQKHLRVDKAVGISVKEGHKNFLRILKKIVWAQIRGNLSPTKMKRWQSEIKSFQRLSNRSWLNSVMHRLPYGQS